MKICRECQHYRWDSEAVFLGGSTGHRCRLADWTDPVMGTMAGHPTRYGGGDCGPEGFLFKARPPGLLARLKAIPPWVKNRRLGNVS